MHRVRFLLKRAAVRSALLGVLLLLESASVAAQEASVLRRGAFGEPESLTPNRSGVDSEIALVLDMFMGLTTYGPGGEIVPGAAHSFQVSDDGLSYVFTLRPELRWSDGAPLTSEDFVYTFRRSVTPATAITRADKLFLLKNARAIYSGTMAPDMLGVTAPDPLTVTLELEHPAPRLPRLLASSEGLPMPAHVIKKYGDAWVEPGKHVSNGAYRLVERRPGEFIRLARNEHFFAATEVAFTEVIYFPTQDLESSVNRFRAGDIQFNGFPGFPTRREAFLRQQLGDAAHTSSRLSVAYLRFNLRRARFGDLRVRQALSLAIQRDALADKVLAGGESPAYNVVAPAVTDYRLATPALNYAAPLAERLAKARELLGAAGFSAAAPLEIQLRYPSGPDRNLVVAIAAMWKPLPVTVELVQSELKSMISDIRRGAFDMALTGALEDDDPEPFLARFLSTSSYNTGGYNDPEFERLFNSALAQADRKDREALLTAAEKQVIDNLPVIPLYVRRSRNLVSPELAGFQDNPPDIHLSRYLRPR
jgi:oligopeptide transport system substrate-binding protein